MVETFPGRHGTFGLERHVIRRTHGLFTARESISKTTGFFATHAHLLTIDPLALLTQTAIDIASLRQHYNIQGNSASLDARWIVALRTVNVSAVFRIGIAIEHLEALVRIVGTRALLFAGIGRAQIVAHVVHAMIETVAS